MLKSIVINLMFFIWPFYLLIDGSLFSKVEEFAKLFLVIFLIVVLDNGFYNLRKNKN